MRPPDGGAVVRGARPHAPRRPMGGASSACVASWGVCVRLMVLLLCMWRVQWVSCRTLVTALLRVAGEAVSTCVASGMRTTTTSVTANDECRDIM